MFASETRTQKIPDVVMEWFKQFFLLEKCIEGLARFEVATLGPVGTSSEAAVGYFISSFGQGKEAKCSLYPSYEQAIDTLHHGAADFVVVANAYERIDRFYMSPETKLLFSFVFDTPEYGVARSPRHILAHDTTLKIATHHAPVSLIPWFLTGLNLDKYEVMTVSSTSQAAVYVQKGEADLCVTNALSVKRYGLKFISPTRAIRMLWSVFGPNNA